MTISARIATLRPIEILAGVRPSTDSTALSTEHYTHTDKVRFKNGKPEKIGGWSSLSFDYDSEIDGTIRRIYSEYIDGQLYYLIGTHKRLYSLIGSILTNITPLTTIAVPAANSLTTHYGTLANNPITTANGTPTLTIADTSASRYRAGDTITLSGAAGVGGILAGAINTDHIIRSIGANSYTINVGTNASSTATGGGASVNRTSGLLRLNDTAHGLEDGDRIMVDNAATFGGIDATNINLEHIIRHIDADNFDFMTDDTATSSVSAGGGASTEYYPQIPAGVEFESAASGYGVGFYGVGLYGTALTSSTGRVYPRTWYFDRFGDSFVITPGNQGAIYEWDGDTTTAPTLVSGAPESNYIFVSDNILVSFGEDDVENRITGSDQGDITQWVSSSTNQVFRDDQEGVSRLISHIKIDDGNLIFTENSVGTMRYIGLPLVWETLSKDNEIGIISSLGGISVNGVGYWMGSKNFYMYRGGYVEVIPANSQKECTAIKYVFNNLNYGQKSQIFAWYNKEFNEIWWHYPSGSSTYPDRVIRVCLTDFVWSIDTMQRTAAESPTVKTNSPRLGDVSTLYNHETGKNADGAALSFTVTSNRRLVGKQSANINSIVPDSIQTGNISMRTQGYLYPQSARTCFDKTFTVQPTKEWIPYNANGRLIQYTWSGSAIDQSWTMGQWFEEISAGANE